MKHLYNMKSERRKKHLNIFCFVSSICLNMYLLYLVMSLLFGVYVTAVEKVRLPDVDRTYLIELLQRTYHDISVNNAQDIVSELENYYTGIGDDIWGNCGPPYQIDKAFHLHIINTRLYAAFSGATFGRFVHHSPFWSGHPTPSDLNERCGDMVKKLRDHGVQIINENLWKTSNCGEEKESTTNLYSSTQKIQQTTEDETYDWHMQCEL